MEENEIFVEELIERLMEYYSRIRKESGVSQSELERITGMSRSAINRYEKGKLMPTVRAMNKLLVPVGYRLAIVPLEEDKEEQDEENISYNPCTQGSRIRKEEVRIWDRK